MHGHACDLTGRIQALDDVGVVRQHLGVDGCRDTAHGVVGGRLDRNRVGVGLDAQVGAGELGDVRELGVELFGWQVGQVEINMVTIHATAAAGADLGVDGSGHHVAGREVLDGRRVALHETLAVLVSQDAAFTAGTLREQNAHLPDARRVELVELHVLQRQSAPEEDAHPVAGQRVRVRGDLEHLAEPTAGEHHRLRSEDVYLAGGQLVGDHPGHDALGEQQVQHVEFVVEFDVVLDALLVERLQDHVTGTVGRITRASDGRFTVVTGVATEATLVDPAFGRAVERQAHLLQVEDRVDGLLAHDLGGVLVDQVVTALDRIEGVPLPVVLLDVGQGCAHTALGRPGVGARGIQLGQHRGATTLAGFERRAHPRAAGAHDDRVVFVNLHRLDLRLPRRHQEMFGSNVKMTSDPSVMTRVADT